MTAPDGDATLAAHIERLRGQLAQCQAVVTSLQGDALGPVMTALIEVKHLRERLDEALAKHQLAPPPAPWWCVGEAEGTEMLAALRKWVDTFLRRHYPGYATRLRACWANHPEAVWELSTLRAEWERVYGDPDTRDLAGALTWHDRWLPGVLGRLDAAIKCDEAGCLTNRARPPPARRDP